MRLIIGFLAILPLLGVAKTSDLESLEGGYRFLLTVETEAGESIEVVEGLLFLSATPLSQPRDESNDLVSLFERGLSFMDLQSGDQPMFCFAAARMTDADAGVMAEYAPLVIAPIQDSDGEGYMPIASWPDWEYGLDINQVEGGFSLHGVGGERAWGYESEWFQVVPDSDVDLSACLSFALEHHGI